LAALLLLPWSSFHRSCRCDGPQEEAHDVLCSVVLQNVPTVRFNLRPKALYMAQMARRVILAHLGRDHLDDKDYFGNKRLELAGQMLALLFEDLFKRFNEELKKTADMVLSKVWGSMKRVFFFVSCELSLCTACVCPTQPNRAASYDVIKSIRQDLITQGLANAIASGNWSAKRFKLERAGVTEVSCIPSFLSHETRFHARCSPILLSN
jgi:DNA-directed RNA polymerase III subunit RPC2